MEPPQEIGPELVFNEEGLLNLYGVQEPVNVYRSIKRYVTYYVGSLVVLTDLISGRREEGKQYPALGMFVVDSFYKRTSLLEFTQ